MKRCLLLLAFLSGTQSTLGQVDNNLSTLPIEAWTSSRVARAEMAVRTENSLAGTVSARQVQFDGMADQRDVMEFIEFNEITVQEALSILADKMGDTNLIASPAASQRVVSLSLRNVTPLAALEVLAASNGLWTRSSSESDSIFVFTNEEREEVSLDIKALEGEINEAFPDSYIKLSKVGGKILLKGEARDALEAEQIFNAVALNTVTTEETREQPTAELELSRSLYGMDGNRRSFGLRTQDVPLAQRVRLGENNVINMLRVPGNQQVNLKVLVAEVNRSATRTIGMNFDIQRTVQTPDANGNLVDQLQSVFSTSIIPAGSATINAAIDGGAALLAIRALREMQLARTVAEPNLTTMHGRPARFHAGGEFPVPQISGFTNAGLQGVAFVPFGCQLTFTPFILDRNNIRLVLSGELSVRDATQVTDIGGSNIQNVNTRNFSTTVELRDGQTFAIAGLIQSGYQGNSRRIPWFGDLPLVGRAAGGDSVTNDERELVILVTPELVQPLDRNERPGLPSSEVFEPDDVEYYLFGRLESRHANNYRSAVRTDFHRQAAYRACKDSFIIGPSGYTDACSDCIKR